VATFVLSLGRFRFFSQRIAYIRAEERRVRIESEKAEANLLKHGVDFSKAATVFLNQLSLTVPAPVTQSTRIVSS